MLGEENTLKAIQPNPQTPRRVFVYDLHLWCRRLPWYPRFGGDLRRNVGRGLSYMPVGAGYKVLVASEFEFLSPETLFSITAILR